MIRAGWQLRIIPAVLLIGIAVVMLQGCPLANTFSPDPEIAAKQQWAKGCQVADSNLQTAKKLWKAGQLDVSARGPLLEATSLYEAVCTGDPPAPGEPIASTVVRVLAARVCPGLAPTNPDDWLLTAIDAAACVAEGALALENR